LRQDAFAPLLLNLELETAIRRCNVERWGTICAKYKQIMAYVDVIMGRRLKDVEVFTSLVKQIRWVSYVFFWVIPWHL
jgi:hypothetical protein